MYRTHNCGELTAQNIGQEITLSGWVQKIRNKGKMIWLDLRDRYGITQVIFEEGITDVKVFEEAQTLGREFVIQVEGIVKKRPAGTEKKDIATGEIELDVPWTLDPAQEPTN